LSAAALELLNRRGDGLREALLSLFERTGVPFTVTGLGSLMTIHPTGAPEFAVLLRKLLFLDLARRYLSGRSRLDRALSADRRRRDFQLLAALESISRSAHPVRVGAPAAARRRPPLKDRLEPIA